VKSGLTRKVHYRGVCQNVWEFFVKVYGGGPAIARTELDLYSKPFIFPEKNIAAEDLASGSGEEDADE
jgi:hypothetical protein